MSGNVCFHFLLLSMNSTHGFGVGLDPIHTEANQKQLFPEINLSSGNELYIHLCGGTSTHVLAHAHKLRTADHVRGAGPRPGSPAPRGREAVRWRVSKASERKGAPGKHSGCGAL